MEHNLLVVSTETRVRMGRMEGLVAQLLIDSHATGTNPARVSKSPIRALSLLLRHRTASR